MPDLIDPLLILSAVIVLGTLGMAYWQNSRSSAVLSSAAGWDSVYKRQPVRMDMLLLAAALGLHLPLLNIRLKAPPKTSEATLEDRLQRVDFIEQIELREKEQTILGKGDKPSLSPEEKAVKLAKIARAKSELFETAKSKALERAKRISILRAKSRRVRGQIDQKPRTIKTPEKLSQTSQITEQTGGKKLSDKKKKFLSRSRDLASRRTERGISKVTKDIDAPDVLPGGANILGIGGDGGDVVQIPVRRTPVVDKARTTASRKTAEVKKTEPEKPEIPLKMESPIPGRDVIKSVLPEYPKWARQRGVEASVLLKFTVTHRGKVKENIFVVKTSGYTQLDELAIDALLQWVFSPLPPGDTKEEGGNISFRFSVN